MVAGVAERDGDAAGVLPGRRCSNPFVDSVRLVNGTCPRAWNNHWPYAASTSLGIMLSAIPYTKSVYTYLRSRGLLMGGATVI